MIWLVPLAVLARPRVWPYILWQLTEVAYFLGIWGYFVYLYQPPAGISTGWYFVILAARLLSLRPARARWSRTSCSQNGTGCERPGSTTTRQAGCLTVRPTGWSSRWHRVGRQSAAER